MSRLISRDPFARTELHRETVKGPAVCSWCGWKGKLYYYYTEYDDHRGKHIHDGYFCGKGCHDAYHS